MIRLTTDRWKHIALEHLDIHLEEIKYTLSAPVAITESSRDSDVRWYYTLNKEKRRHLLVAVNT